MAGCPSCHSEFIAENIAGTTVATCSKCDGVWLTRGDLDRVTGLELEDNIADWVTRPTECRHCRVSIGMSPRCVQCGEYPALECPRGHGTMQTARIEIAGREFEADLCTECSGVWLDGHEQKHLEAAPGPPPKVYSAVPSSPSNRDVSTERTVQVIRDLQRRHSGFQHRYVTGWKNPGTGNDGLIVLVAVAMIFMFMLLSAFLAV